MFEESPMEGADIREYRQIDIHDVTSGERFATKFQAQMA
jgi:aspartate 1-decarboxylase